MRGLATSAMLALGACATHDEEPLSLTPVAGKSLVLGTIQRSVSRGTPNDFLPPDRQDVFLAAVNDWKLDVRRVLSGVDPGPTVTVRTTAASNPIDGFEGKSVVVMIDPDLQMLVPGQSWWTSTDELACVPETMLGDPAYAAFVRMSVADGGQRCVELR